MSVKSRYDERIERAQVNLTDQNGPKKELFVWGVPEYLSDPIR